MEWLSEISIKWVLFVIGSLGALLAVLRIARVQGPGPAALGENLQVAASVLVVVFLIIRPFLFQAFFIPSGSMEPTLQINDRLIVDKLVFRVSDPHRYDIVVFKAPPAASPDEKDFIKRTIGLPNDTVEVVPPRLRVDNRTVAALADSQSGFGGRDRVRADVAPSGLSAVVSGSPIGADVSVMAEPTPDVQFDGREVRVDGAVELTDSRGPLSESGDLPLYDEDPSLHARVFNVAGSPRLIVVPGRRLSFDPGHVLVNGQRLTEPYIAEAPMYAKAPQKLGPGEYFMMGDNRNNSQDSHIWGPLKRDRVIGRAEILFWPPARLRVFRWWLLSALAGMFLGYHALYWILGGR